jgi:hypothetical protein
MNVRGIAAHVEFASDRMYQAAEDAAAAVEAADTEARYDTTRGEVLEHLTMHMTRDDDKVFMRALRQEGRQSIAMMIGLIHTAFRAVVAEKKRAILARQPEPEDEPDGSRH